MFSIACLLIWTMKTVVAKIMPYYFFKLIIILIGVIVKAIYFLERICKIHDIHEVFISFIY